MKPRILYLSALPLGVGGIETHLLGLFDAAASEYETLLFAPARDSFIEEARARGCRVFSWRVEGVGDIQAWYALFHFLRKMRPALVHVHDARAASIVRPLATLFPSLPIVNTVHLPPYYYRFEGRFSRFRKAIYSRIEKLMNRMMTTKIIYVGRHIYEEALSLGYARSKQARLIENGIDLTSFRGDYAHQRDALRIAREVPVGEPVLICVARLSAPKRQDVLLRAASIIKKEGVAFRLWLVGDGVDRAALERLSQELGLESVVVFLGSRTDISLLLASSDVFILLSDYEGRTLSVMEAQAAGLPCVLSAVGDHPFMINDRETGLIVPPNNAQAAAKAIRELLVSPSRRKTMGELARQHALSDYDLDVQTARTLDIYAELLV